MTVTTEPIVEWTQDSMVEVMLNEPDDFLKVRETLTRIGVASRKEKKLYQSCHILHKQGRYFIVHFKELFALDGKHANLTSNDVQRRNRIARLLADWGLISIVKESDIADIAPLNQIKVLAYKDKGDWILEQKYNIGKKTKPQEEQMQRIVFRIDQDGNVTEEVQGVVDGTCVNITKEIEDNLGKVHTRSLKPEYYQKVKEDVSLHMRQNEN